MDHEKVAGLMKEILVELGEDPNREGLVKTPMRAAKALSFLTKGYKENVDELVNGAVFESSSNNMIMCKNIEVYSMCEHHMLPFFGRCHIGYIADGKVLGLSKLARIVDLYGRRLQIQENMTAQIAQEVMNAVGAKGVGVVMECKHLCMMMRGVEKQHSAMTTSSILGSFREEEATRLEFLNLTSKR